MGKANSGQIKKGEIRNPGGRPKTPDDLKLLMRSTGEQMKRDMCETWNMDLHELLDLAGATSGISAGKAALISCLNNAFQSGDLRPLQIFLDRILGKPQEAIELSYADDKEAVNERDETISRLVAMITEKK